MTSAAKKILILDAEAHRLMLRLRILREAAEELDAAATYLERERPGYAPGYGRGRVD